MVDIEKLIKQILIEEGKTQTQLAEILGYANKQGLNKMLNKKDHRISDILKMANALDYDVSITLKSRKTGKEFISD